MLTAMSTSISGALAFGMLNRLPHGLSVYVSDSMKDSAHDSGFENDDR
jgi:hypothetical protein